MHHTCACARVRACAWRDRVCVCVCDSVCVCVTVCMCVRSVMAHHEISTIDCTFECSSGLGCWFVGFSCALMGLSRFTVGP